MLHYTGSAALKLSATLKGKEEKCNAGSKCAKWNAALTITAALRKCCFKAKCRVKVRSCITNEVPRQMSCHTKRSATANEMPRQNRDAALKMPWSVKVTCEVKGKGCVKVKVPRQNVKMKYRIQEWHAVKCDAALKWNAALNEMKSY